MSPNIPKKLLSKKTSPFEKGGLRGIYQIKFFNSNQPSPHAISTYSATLPTPALHRLNQGEC